MLRHTQIEKYVRWWILKYRGVKATKTWLTYEPKDTMSTGNIIMWDVTIPMDAKIKCYRPDITIHVANKRTCVFIDVSGPACTNVVRKEAEKIVKYRDLEIEVQKYWNLTKVCTILIVVGALGTTCNGILEYIKSISPKIKFRMIQKTKWKNVAH